MTRVDMMLELGRLDAVCSIGSQDEAKRNAFIEELERKFSWLLQSQWREVVSWVVDHHKTRGIPVVSEFSSAVDAVRNKGGIKREDTCRTCHNNWMVSRRYRHREHEEWVIAAVPCPDCRKGMHLDIKNELSPAEPDTLGPMAQLANELGPEGAKCAINLIKGNFPEKITEILLSKTETVCVKE